MQLFLVNFESSIPSIKNTFRIHDTTTSLKTYLKAQIFEIHEF